MKLQEPVPVRRAFSGLKRLPINAQTMDQATFQQLVDNLRNDGYLTSMPLIYSGGEYPEGGELILSGNHRVDAAEQAGIAEGWCLLIEQPLPRARQIALELSHNAINGEPDLAILRQRYEAIDDIEWKAYAGLDDKTLELLEKVDVGTLSEANLDFQQVQVVFLPHEADRAREVLDELSKTADERWLAAYKDYLPLLDSLASVHSAFNVGNVATAFGIMIALVERHITDLRDGYLDPASEEPRHKGHVALEVVFGSRTVPAVTATALTRALKAEVDAGRVEPDKPWLLLEKMLAAYRDQQPA